MIPYKVSSRLPCCLQVVLACAASSRRNPADRPANNTNHEISDHKEKNKQYNKSSQAL